MIASYQNDAVVIVLSPYFSGHIIYQYFKKHDIQNDLVIFGLLYFD